MTPAEVQTRRAHPGDAEAIALAHLDSIRSIGPTFYPPDVVEEWASGLTPDIYVKAMEGGEAFFVATGHIDGQPVVLGFSTHRVDDAQDGMSVYVRGGAARRGIGTTLLRLAEAHALESGATSIQIQASLAGIEFYKANGFEEIGRGEALLMSGRSMPCVFMRKPITAPSTLAASNLQLEPTRPTVEDDAEDDDDSWVDDEDVVEADPLEDYVRAGSLHSRGSLPLSS